MSDTKRRTSAIVTPKNHAPVFPLIFAFRPCAGHRVYTREFDLPGCRFGIQAPGLPVLDAGQLTGRAGRRMLRGTKLRSRMHRLARL